MNPRKKLTIQLGTQGYVLAVYNPDTERWEPMVGGGGALAEAYVAFARDHGFADLEEAGASILRLVPA